MGLPPLARLLSRRRRSRGGDPLAELDAQPAPAGAAAVDLDEEPPAGGRRLALYAAVTLPLVLLGGVVLWLSLTAGDTVGRRLAAVPRVVVPVVDARGPAQASPKAGPEAGQASAPADGKPATPLNPIELAVEMAPAPDPALVERMGDGLALPRIAPDGRTPWQTYARPFVHEDPQPRIALVMTDLGLSRSMTIAALDRLPGPVTLAFPAQAPGLEGWIAEARRRGHEVVLDLPMEPQRYPAQDPGPDALMTGLPAKDNIDRLHRSLGRAAGYVGVTSLSGSAFTADAAALDPVLKELSARGLILVDARAAQDSRAASGATAAGLPRAVSDGTVDLSPSAEAIDAELAALEEAARSGQAAVGFLGPYPVTLERLALWLPTLAGKGITLAPVTAVVNRQPDR
jgi:uncharacterized protein